MARLTDIYPRPENAPEYAARCRGFLTQPDLVARTFLLSAKPLAALDSLLRAIEDAAVNAPGTSRFKCKRPQDARQLPKPFWTKCESLFSSPDVWLGAGYSSRMLRQIAMCLKHARAEAENATRSREAAKDQQRRQKELDRAADIPRIYRPKPQPDRPRRNP